MTKTVVEVEGLKKSYPGTEAVKSISFDIEEGELFGLIGPDGAGKTTTMRILCGLLTFDAGACAIFGFDVKKQITEIKKIIGYMPQRFSLYPDLSVDENLRFFADLYKVPNKEREHRLERLLKFSNLGPFQKRRAEQLSGGMKQKLALSCTMIHTPRLLVLDEPTTGVDPVSRREFWQILHDLKNEGVSILVSTPYMDEAKQCDRIAMMHRGEILAIDSTQNISRLFTHQLLEIVCEALIPTAKKLEQLDFIESVQIFGDKIHVTIKDNGDVVMKKIEKEVPTITSMEIIPPSIEDTFIELMKH